MLRLRAASARGSKFFEDTHALVMYARAVRLPDLFSDSSRLALDGCRDAGRNKLLELQIRGESPLPLSVLLHPRVE